MYKSRIFRVFYEAKVGGSTYVSSFLILYIYFKLKSHIWCKILILKPFLSNSHSQNSKIKCLAFIFWTRLMQSYVYSFTQFETVSHHNYLCSIMAQISSLCDSSTNERPHRKKNYKVTISQAKSFTTIKDGKDCYNSI